jgi:hypothetical protein
MVAAIQAIYNKLIINLSNPANGNSLKDEKTFNFYKIDNNPVNDDPKKLLTNITIILKNNPKIMIESNINDAEYKAFSDELRNYVLGINTTIGGNIINIQSIDIKPFCDLVLFDILCRMRLDLFNPNVGNKYPFIFDPPAYAGAGATDVDNIGGIKKNENLFNAPNNITIETFLTDNIKALEIIHKYIGDFEIRMEKKILLYKILQVFFEKIIKVTKPLKIDQNINHFETRYQLIIDNFNPRLYNSTAPAIGPGVDKANEEYCIDIIYAYFMFYKLVKQGGCAPRTIVESYTGGNKSGKYDYYLCKCNFKESLKKVVAKTAREAAKNLAKKVLKGNKKSIKFTLKRLIGKKEKYYNYEAHFDKNGKIVIKNQ